MKTTKFLSTLMLLTIALILSLQSIGQQLPDYVGKSDKIPNFNTGKSGPILFDQMYNPGTNYMVSQHFTTITNNTKTCAASDDFDVPTGETWDVHSIGIVGSYWQGDPGGGDTLNVFLLSDNNGIPGDTIQEYIAYTNFLMQEETVGDIVNTYFEIILPSIVSFTEGKYWVSVQMYSAMENAGQWGWREHYFETAITGEEWYWINPKDGWEMGATDWTPASIVVGPWLSWELSFALFGEPNSNDLSTLEITSPNDFYNSPPVDEQEVKMVIKNEGENTQTAFDVMYNFNGVEVTENVGSVSIANNETYEYTFTSTIDLSTPGTYSLSVSTMLVGDEVPENDMQSMEITVYDPTVYTMPSMQTTSITTCSGTFADAGGLEGDLVADDWGTITIYPATTGAKIRLEFLQFEIGWSDFWIYDGENTNATELGYWENNISPGTITASYQNTSGALTIHFEAQGWTPFEKPGWAANIICHNEVEDDFEVMKIELSHPLVFENDYVTAFASVKNVGTTVLEKNITFSANGIDYASASTGMLQQSDTVIVEVIWNPTTEGDYELVATTPDDEGNYNNSASMNQHVFPFDHFCEGFELEQFPPDGWSQSSTMWTRNDYSPAVGVGHAYLWAEYGLFDTLYTPKLHIEAGDKVSFYAYSSAWWPGELDLCWIDGETGDATLIQAVPLPYMAYQFFEIDVTDATGDNYLGFVGKYNPGGGQGEVKLDEVCGIGIERFFYEDDLKAYVLGGSITPVEDEPTTFNVEIKNIGSEFQSGSNYTVKLMQDSDTELMSYPGQDINPKEVLDFTMDYTFTSAGLYHCTVEIEFADDQDISNNISTLLDIYVQQEGTEQVHIGTSEDYSNNAWYPIITQPTGMYSQVLYLAEDVGEANTITGIMYYYKYDNNYPVSDIPLTIWMSETEKTNMSDSLEAANDYYKVFEGTVDYQPGIHEVYIPLDFVYSYQGDNLMVTTYKDYTEDYIGASSIATSYVADTMVRYYNGYENGEPIDPYDQQSLDSVYLHQKTEFANVKFFKFNLEGQYCTPQTLNGTTAGDYVDGVTFNEIENLSTGSQGGPAYNNYTSMSSNVERGRTYELTIQAETSGTNGSIAAWIDFNGNHLLDDEGERVVHISSSEASQEITVQVTIPDDASIGLTILRIRNSSEADLFASCQAVDYGETEDYGINIIETIQVYSSVPDFAVSLLDNGNVDMNWIVPENPGIAQVEGFEMSNWPPEGGWEVKQSTTLDGTLNDPTGDTWSQYNEFMQFVYNGSYSALSPALAIDFNWLITPEVQLYGNDELSFMLNYSSDANGYSKFYVLVEADGEWSTVLEYTDEVTMYNNYDNIEIVELNQFAGKVVRIAFVTEFNNAYPVAIDDIVLSGVGVSGKSVSGITGYDIYRNDEIFAEIADPSVTEYSDLLDETENYIYCIYAMYDDGEKSEENCDEVFFLAPLTAPLNVLAASIDNDVFVTWVAPNSGMQRFEDTFEDYDAGQQVACQNPDDWTTWTLDPCGANDPYISTEQAYSGDNSVLNEGVSDLLYLHDEMLEAGKYSFNFRMFIPQGYNGYFNVLQDHDLTIGALWGMQAFFDANGIGTLDGGGYGSATFSYEYDKWFYVELVMDLDTDWAQFVVEGELIHEWQWSTGIGGSSGWNTFEGVDFYSWNTNGTAKYFVDDVYLTQIYEPNIVLDYNVYRNGSLVGTVSTTEFEDPDVAPGEHDYCVSAVYDEGESAQVCDYVWIFTAPQNFTAEVENGTDVLCTWDEISSSDGYNLYKDDELLEANISTTEWTDTDVEGGSHTYYVTAVYSNGESIPSNSASVVLLLIPSNLVAEADNDGNIVLDWDGVGTVSTGELIQLSQHNENPANGLYEWFDFGYGVVYDLSGYTGTTIEMVDFFHSSYGITGTWSYMIHIIDWTYQTEITEIGPFQTTGNDTWELEIPLESVLPTSNLIGIFLEPMSNDPQDAYPILACDELLDGLSFQVSLNDLSLYDPSPGDFLMDLWIMAEEGKKMVKAKKYEVNNLELKNVRAPYIPVLGEITPNQKANGSKSLQGYNVYYSYNSGGFENIAIAEDTTFVHEGAAVEGLHTYYVTSNYDEGESDPSNEASVLISSVGDNMADDMNIYPNPFTDDLMVNSDNSISAVIVVNAQGQVVYEKRGLNSVNYRIELNDQLAGIYQIRIETENGWTNYKVIKR